MSTPAGLKCVPKALATGDKVHIYSDATHIILQLRRFLSTDGTEDLLNPSFKVAVSLEPAEAVAIASELLVVALPQLNKALAEGEIPPTNSPHFIVKEDELQQTVQQTDGAESQT